MTIHYIFSILRFCSIGLLLTLWSISAQASADDGKTRWFRDAGFGVFIHFGANSTHPDDFNPKNFDATSWIKKIKQAGAKYVVYTTKHHNGMSNWDSALTDWNVVKQTPFKRDIVKELAAAAKAEGIKLGFYYSIADWHHSEYDPRYSNRKGFHYTPNPKADMAKYMAYMYGQVKELCDKYQPSLFWFDGSAGFRNKDRKRMLGQQDMVDMLHECGSLSNSRLGDDDTLKYVDYLSTGDNMVPASNLGVDFEVAGTMNDSWHFKDNDNNWKSNKELLSLLVDIAGKGGNYLLNVGPTELGEFPDESVVRLKTIGNWLEINGEAIYGTKAGPYAHELGWGSMTQKYDGKHTSLYLNVVNWPKDGKLELYGINNNVLGAQLLASGNKLKTSEKFDASTGLNVKILTLPTKSPDENVSVIKLTLVGEVTMNTDIIQQTNGVVSLDGYQANSHDVEYVANKPHKVIDNRQFTVMSVQKGIIPAHTMSVGGLTQVGQALSWDFKLIEPGKYDVAVVSFMGKEGKIVEESGNVRVTVAGQSLENQLTEYTLSSNVRMAHHFKDALSVVGEVHITSAGAHTLSLEVTSETKNKARRIRSVMLLPK